jgi:hypothetical protein
MIVRVAALAAVAALALPCAAAQGDTPAYLYLKTTGFYGAVDMVPSGSQVGDCTTYCTFAFPRGTNVRLTAQPGQGRFLQWSPWATRIGSLCFGTSRTCTITMNSSTAVRAVFSPVSLRVTSTDGGFVSVRNPGPPCGSSCYLYDLGAIASIHAEAVGENAFRGWSGGCVNAGPDCGVRMTDNRVLGASFRCTSTDSCSIRQPLTTKLNFWVKVIGGRVSGSLSCGGSCLKQVGVGQQLSLRASSGRVQWLSRVIRCASGSSRCTFKVGTNSTSSSPLLVVRFY